MLDINVRAYHKLQELMAAAERNAKSFNTTTEQKQYWIGKSDGMQIAIDLMKEVK